MVAQNLQGGGTTNLRRYPCMKHLEQYIQGTCWSFEQYETEFIDKLILEVFSNFSQCVATKIVKFVAKDMCLLSVV